MIATLILLAQTQTLSDLAKTRHLHQRPGNFSAAQSTAPKPSAVVPAPAASTPETVWTARAARLREELAAAREALQRADEQNTVVAWGRPGAAYAIAMAARNAALTPYRVRVAELEAALARLPEECRTTPGCSPGWVR